MSRPIMKALIAVLALGATVIVVEPASATPMNGAAAIELARTATSVGTEQIYYRRGYRGRYGYGYGYRRPFGYRHYRYGYRRGIPGHPIRRLLRSL